MLKKVCIGLVESIINIKMIKISRESQKYSNIKEQNKGLVDSLRNLFAKRAPAPLMRWVHLLRAHFRDKNTNFNIFFL